MIDELEYLREQRPMADEVDSGVALRARRALLRRALGPQIRRRRLTRGLASLAAAAVVVSVIGFVNFGDRGPSSASASILTRSADTFSSSPAPQKGQYLYVRSVETDYNFGPSSARKLQAGQPDVGRIVLETWIPGDKSVSAVERLTGSDDKVFVTPASTTDNPELFDHHPRDAKSLLAQLRALSDPSINTTGTDTEQPWRAAFSLLLNAQAPDDLKADTMRALATISDVVIVDKNADVNGKAGIALGMRESSAPQLVFTPDTGEFLGAIGYPERGPNWRGPAEPRYTVALESKIVESAPDLP